MIWIRILWNLSCLVQMFEIVLLSSLFSSVAPGFEAMKDQNICNKIMAKLIQSYSSIFQSDGDGEGCTAEQATLIIFKVLYTHGTQEHQMPMFIWNRSVMVVRTM